MINKIILDNFRNFRKKSIVFSDKVTVILGPNAAGKSNILEAIYLLATGKSYKARIEEEMVSYSSEIARVKCQMTNDKFQITNLECVLTRGEIEHEGGKIQRTPRKRLFVSGVPRRLIDFAGNLKVVLFGPWDLDLVTESPSIRRRFLDSVLFQVDREYRRASLAYDRGLRQRNRLLLKIRDENVSRTQLLFWNSLLIKNGDYISNKRRELIEYINKSKTQISNDKLRGNQERNKSETYMLNSESDNYYFLEYDKSAISESRLEQYREEEIAAGMTLVGPHRDDFRFQISNYKFQIDNNNNENGSTKRNLAIYGSRGEQRMGVLWLKLAELSFIESVTEERPTLLLDDIFSELDHEHRDIVFKIAEKQQTIITTADPHFVQGMVGEKIEL